MKNKNYLKLKLLNSIFLTETDDFDIAEENCRFKEIYQRFDVTED